MLSLILNNSDVYGDVKAWIFVLILLNIYIYVLTLLTFFSILFLSNMFFFKITTNLRIFAQTVFNFNALVFLFLSLAGMPPFLSFIGKFFLFVCLLINDNVMFTFFFFLFNSFVIYFYVQHLRLFWTKKRNITNFFKNNFIFLNFNLYFLITFFLFFLIFGGFFITDVYIYLSPFLI